MPRLPLLAALKAKTGRQLARSDQVTASDADTLKDLSPPGAIVSQPVV